jgi:hypothetical protein
MNYLLWGIAAIGLLFLLDRLALWAEGRGWMYYRKKQGSSGAVGNAFLEVQTIFEPGKRHILEERMKKSAESQASGDKPKTGDDPKKD